MRIRKHFHLSSLLSGASVSGGDSSRLPSRICRLNQSPWDVFDSPPSPPQVVDGDDSFPAAAHGGTSANSVAATHSVTNTKMFDDGEANYFDSSEEGEEEEQRVMCGKSDGKGWRCKSEAAKGNLLCEHHLELLRNYHPSNKSSSKKKKMKEKEKQEGDFAAPVSKSSRRVRARKTPMSSNPYEFYYYSGFGPSWGKKRGAKKKDELVVAEEEEDSHSSSSSSQIDRINNVEDDEDQEEEEEEPEAESRAIRKRSGRKPIKARSLKSLM